MKRLRLLFAALAAGGLALFTLGCGSDKPVEKPAEPGSPATRTKTDAGAAKKGGAKMALETKGTGNVKGRVVFDGEPPAPAKLDINKDQDHCNKGPKDELVDPTWRVGSDKGVANVIVWVQAPDGKYFNIPEAQRSVKQAVTIDQPFCAFEPHVFVIFPTYFDGKRQQPTGQKLVVKNSAPIPHNSNVSFSEQTLNTGGNQLLASGKDMPIDNILPCKETDCSKSSDATVTCNIHQWMKAFGKIFDHPYVAVSSGGGKDEKAFGNFEIKNAPAGAEVSIMYWHESMPKPAELKKITLKEGDNDVGEIKLKK